MFDKLNTKKVFIILIALLAVKVTLGSLLIAENPDTYDFFKVAYHLKNFDWTVASKRMPLLPALIAFFPVDWYVMVGRIWINLFYLGSIIIFYRYFRLVLKLKSHKVEKGKEKSLSPANNNLLPLLATLVFATNIVVLENSFYILADAIFLFWNILYLYIYKKNGVKSLFLLILISTAAFYTRPEGLILFGITGIFTLHAIIKKCGTVSVYKAMSIGVMGGLLISPYFLRNLILYDKLLYSGYLSDKAGFLFDTQTVLMRTSSIIFGVGGVWLLTIVYMQFKKLTLKNLFTVEVLMFAIYAPALFMWGPYIRLYSVPLTLIIIFVMSNLDHLQKYKVDFKRLIIPSILLVISSMLYAYVVQEYDHSDLGYRKIGKAIALLGSTLPMVVILLKDKVKIVNKNFIAFFALSIIVINLGIYIDKFRITRYKNATIFQATHEYLSTYSHKGNLGYDSNTDLEQWYVKDFEEQYDFLKHWDQLDKWSEKNNIRYIITSQEGGSNDKFIDFGKLSTIEHKVVAKYSSPFFHGETRLIELNHY